ncbi:BTP domain-containing protein [Aphelenchoides fujianensis]|nr:BTP domain-containing protein [Aphelenchoides fujianensis]
MEYWLDDDKNPVDEFTNFHFAQASAAILDNLGFSAATTDAIEIMSSLMRRYFDDLCHRVSNFSENAGRQSATISDLNMAFKSQNISISELHEYVQQVRTLSLPTSTLPLYPSAEFVDSKSETKFFFADPFDDHVPAVEEVELLYGKRKPPVENGVPEEGGEGSKPTEEGEKPDSGIDSMQVEPIENPEPTVVWQLPDFKGIPDFSALSADDLGFDMELFNQKHQEAEMRKTAKANISHTRSKPPVLSDSTLKSAETALKQTSLNSLVDKIKKHKNKEKKRLKDKKKDKERVGAHGEKSRHRKKHRDPYPKEAPVLTPATTLGELLKPTAPVFPSATAPILPAAVSAPPVVSTPPPVLSAAAPPPVKAPERFETPKPLPKPASPVPLPPTKVEATSNNNVEKPPAKPVLTPPPPLEQAAPVVKVKTPVPDQPLTTPQPPPVANELKKDKSHKKDKEKKREKKKEKKRDKERDPTKSAERNKEKKNKEKRRSAGDKSTIQMPSLAREADASGLMTSMRTPPPETTPSTAIATANGHGTEETSTRTDPPPRISPAENAPVKLTIRIGRTASNDSVKHSPQEASAPQKTSPTNTPPLLSQEPAAPSETPAMVEKLLVKRDFEPAAGGDPDEPPRKKHKSMKKEKRDKEQRDSLGGEAEKSEKHKKKSKEHKEKRKMRDGEAKPVPSTSTTPIPPAKEAKNGDPVVSPLKMPKLSAPGR